MNIVFIPSSYSNSISCITSSLFSDYLLSSSEQQYIETLSDNTESVISSAKLTAAVKAGSSMYTQQTLNNLYVRKDDIEFTENDKENLKNFLNTQMVGNNIGEILSLK